MEVFTFDDLIGAPVQFLYPGNWSIAQRVETGEDLYAVPANKYITTESTRIISPSKEIEVTLHASKGYHSIPGSFEGQLPYRLPDNAIKLNDFEDTYYVEIISTDTSKGMGVIDAYITNLKEYSNTYITLNGVDYFCADINIEGFRNKKVTQDMIDQMISSDEFKAAKNILLSAKKINIRDGEYHNNR